MKKIFLYITSLLATNIYPIDILVNQVGYSLYEEKFIYLCSETKLKDLNFSVIKKNINKEIFKSTMCYYGEYYDKYYYLIDITSLKEGEYYIETNGVKSTSVIVKKNVYNKLYLHTLNGYYFVQRCGVEVPGWHKACHLDDGVVPPVDKKLVDQLILNQPPDYKPATHIDVTGGWHDAGDYNKYVGNAAVALGVLGLAFEEFGLTDDNNQNKIPDLVEEIEFGVKWLLKMQDKDGGVFERVFSGYEYKGLPEKETNNKKGDSDDRYLDIDKYTDITGKFVAACAISYRVIKNYDPEFAKQVLESAFKGWDWIKKNPNKYDTIPWSFGRYPGDKSAVVWAAIELYQTTKNFDYLDFAERKVLEIKAVNGSLNHMSWIFQPVVALSKIYLFSNYDAVKKVVLRELNRYLKKYIETALENPFSIRTGFIDAWEWGTNGIILGSGFDLYWISKVLDDKSILNMAQKCRQWVLGLNPVGKSFVVGIGNKSVENPYSLLLQSMSEKKKVVGAVVPGLYISQGKPFYTEQQGSFKCNEATIDAAALFVFNSGISESEVCFNIISPLRYSTVKGKIKLEIEVISKVDIDNVEYKIDNFEYKSLTKTQDKFSSELDTSLFQDGEHLIYLRAIENNKVVGGTFFKINVENIKKQPKILILSPQMYGVYVGGTDLVCKLNVPTQNLYELYFSLDDGKTWSRIPFKDKKFYSEIIPDKPGESNFIVKAINNSTKEEFKSEKIKIFISRSGKLQTEEYYRVVNDASQSPIGQEKRRYDDSGCVVMPDENDTIAIDFFVCQDGNYILRHRERSGDTYWKSQTSRWDQNTYEYTLDGQKIELKPKLATTTKDPDLYGEYWGVRESGKIFLKKGKHSFVVKTKQVWAYSDYLEVLYETDTGNNFLQPKVKMLDNFEKAKLDWGSYRGPASELNIQITNTQQRYGENSLKAEFLNKDYVGLVYNNKSDWSNFDSVELWVYTTERTKIHFVIEERKEKTFWGCDYEIMETNKWLNVNLPFVDFNVDTGYQPGNKDDKKLDLDDVMTFHISPRTPQDKMFTIYIDDLRLTKK